MNAHDLADVTAQFASAAKAAKMRPTTLYSVHSTATHDALGEYDLPRRNILGRVVPAERILVKPQKIELRRMSITGHVFDVMASTPGEPFIGERGRLYRLVMLTSEKTLVAAEVCLVDHLWRFCCWDPYSSIRPYPGLLGEEAAAWRLEHRVVAEGDVIASSWAFSPTVVAARLATQGAKA